MIYYPLCGFFVVSWDVGDLATASGGVCIINLLDVVVAGTGLGAFGAVEFLLPLNLIDAGPDGGSAESCSNFMG